jgi:sugar phosphate isomerase/epimerase
MAADRLSEPGAVAKLQEFLRASGLYIFTINAFPYGPFHGTRVKEGVYEPDWRAGERLRFTNCVADILALLLPAGMDGSISTVPGAYRTRVKGSADVERMADAMIRHAAHLHAIADRTGKAIALALEPEPSCFIESTAEAVAFFENHLFGEAAVARFRQLSQTSKAQAEAALRRHLALCLDVCHAAVGFEDVRDSLDRLRGAGIRLAKVQLSSALKLEDVQANAEALLSPFDDGIYLHQTVESNGGDLVRYADLSDAFAALRQGRSGGEWRVHCHVPLFCESYGQLESTQAILADILAVCREREVAPHLEVETYTWGVLPADMRVGDISGDIARELAWVCSQLDG